MEIILISDIGVSVGECCFMMLGYIDFNKKSNFKKILRMAINNDERNTI